MTNAAELPLNAAVTHYGVIIFDGDPGDTHPNPRFRGRPPYMLLAAGGSESWCWSALTALTREMPLVEGQHAEVLKRDPLVAEAELEQARAAAGEGAPE